ncbi:MAG: bifunctional riboflavin kinase/FAD synthetase, partial [Wujia sp.]
IEVMDMNIVSSDEVKLDNTTVALGKFQGLHLGHMLLLDKTVDIARENGLNSVVCSVDVPYDRTLYNNRERCKIIEKKGIDFLVKCPFTKEFAALTPLEFVKSFLVDKLNAKYVVVGSDFCFGCNRQGNVDTLKKICGEFSINVVIIDKLSVDGEIISTSYIKKLILSGNIQGVEKFLGRYYSITGVVSHGRRLGRTLGFPTINIIPDEEKLLPPFGVYESLVYCGHRVYKGVTNIGTNPTICSDKKISVETNIIDFNGDLYDNEITVAFVRYLRPQKKFNTVDELKNQITLDKMSVMHQ